MEGTLRSDALTVATAQQKLLEHARTVARVRRELLAAARRLREAAGDGEVLGYFGDGTPATVEGWVAGTLEDLAAGEVAGLGRIFHSLAAADHRAEVLAEVTRESRHSDLNAQVRELADRIRAVVADGGVSREELAAMHRRFRELTEDPVPPAARLQDPRPAHLRELGLTFKEFAELRGE